MTTLIHVTPATYARRDGRAANASLVALLPLQVLAEGITTGNVVEVGDYHTLRLAAETTAHSGSSPTLDATVQTSDDAVTDWKTVAAFAQQTDVGLAMSAVAETGTTPPDVTLSGTPLIPMDLRIECTTLGNRGTSKIRYSVDGGVTFVESDVTTGATKLLKYLDASGALVTTGVTMSMENAAAAVNNVWTAKTAGFERKSFGPLGRFVRVVGKVGGTGTPTVTAKVTGELVG